MKSLSVWCEEKNKQSLLDEWMPERNGEIHPFSISYGSEKKVWWKCKEGHEWTATVNSRTMGHGCPYCSGRMAVQGKNDLQTVYPNIAKEWHPLKNGELKPFEVTCRSNRKIWWLCTQGHDYEATINNRIRGGNGCPYCSGHKTLEGYNDLKTWCISNNREELLNEWDYEKNDIKPSLISPKNNKKVWWKCSLGHEWDATIGARTATRSSGCPYCSNPPKKILVGFNDFESWCYKNEKTYLLDEWNYDRNTSLGPREISYGCGKKVWWKCSKGHEWFVAPSNRIQGTGCPICSRTQTSFPEQAVAFYVSKYFNIIQRYREKGYELDIYLPEFKIGIEYDGMFYHDASNSEREKDKNEYYKDNGISIIHIKEDKIKSGLIDDAIYFIPPKKKYINQNFNEMIIQLLDLLEQWTGMIIEKDVDIFRDELAIREQYYSILKESSLAIQYPELVSEWDYEKNNGTVPESFSANSHIKVWWKCKRGHSWQAEISSRCRKLGCPFCAGQRTIAGENDLESWCHKNNQEFLLDEWDYSKNTVLPSEITKTSNKKVWWRCSKGHEWQAGIANRVHGTKCPGCFSGNEVKRGSISFAEWCKDNDKENLLNEWDYSKNSNLSPNTVSKGSHIKVWWKCQKGHEWEAQVKSRTYNHGCPFCSGTYKKALVGNNDLVTWCKENHKEYILEEWDYDANGGANPQDYTYGSHKRFFWKCLNGHCWSAVIKERTKFRGNMCPFCKQ